MECLRADIGKEVMKKPKMEGWKLFFIPSETIFHPETGETLLHPRMAVSTEALMLLYAETGMDNCKGTMVTLNLARWMRHGNEIDYFRISLAESVNYR